MTTASHRSRTCHGNVAIFRAGLLVPLAIAFAHAASAEWVTSVQAGAVERPAKPLVVKPLSTPPPQQAAAPEPPPPVEPQPEPELPATDGETARAYCRVVLDRATRERIAAEQRASEELSREIEVRLGKLNESIARHEQWLKQRQDFQKKAQEGLVRVFAAMPAETAAPRLAASEEPVAAAILSLMTPKQASAVLGEMSPEKAARLTAYMAGAAEVGAAESDAGRAPR